MADKAETRLRQDAVGVIAIVFFVVAFAAPLAAIGGVAPIIFGAAGSSGAPGAYAVCTLVLIVFSVGFAAMSREHSGPGGFAVYIARAFGSRAGFGSAFIAVLGYAAFLAGNIGLLGYLTQQLVATKLGVDLPWWVWALGAVGAIAALGYREVGVSVVVLGVFLALELLILLVMAAVTFAKGGASGVNVDGFSLDGMSSGAPGIVFLLAFACFVGFEATTLFGEEARDRHRTIPRATYVAVVLVGVFYTGVMWTFQVGYGGEASSVANNDPGNFILNLNTRYVGAWSSEVMQWLLVTSIFAACLSMHSALSRYLFALGRDGVLPTSFGRAHPTHGSPHVASHIQSVATTVVVASFAIAGLDPYLSLYSWLVGVGAVSVLVLYMVSSLAVCVVLRRGRHETRPWVTTIAPVLACLAMAFFLWLALHNYSALTGSTSDIVNRLYILVPAAALLGWILSRGHIFDSTSSPEAVVKENA